MRDIRDDLIERLEAANAEIASARTEYDADRRELEQRFHKKFEEIGARQRALGLLIDAETLPHSAPTRPVISPPELRLPLQDFILNGLSSVGAMTKDDVKEMVERAGYTGPHESAGRMVHTTLMNIVKSGKIRLLPDGRYDVTMPYAIGAIFTSDLINEHGPQSNNAGSSPSS